MFNQFLTKRFNDQLQWFEAKAAKQKKHYHALQTSVVVLSASMPVLVTTVKVDYNWVTATASVMLAIGTALLKMLHLPEAWINYRDTAQCLRQEQSWLEFQIGPYEELEAPAARKKFIARVEDILSKESGNWRSTAMAPIPNGSNNAYPTYGMPQQTNRQPQQQQPRGDRQDRQGGGSGDRQGGGSGDRQGGGSGDRQDRQGGHGGGSGQQPPPPMQERVPRQDVDLGNVG